MAEARLNWRDLRVNGCAGTARADWQEMVELVWDATRRGTGRAASGASLAVGEDAHFSPADLVSLAAASCLMKTFLGLAEAAHVPLLSYLSTAELAEDKGPGGRSQVRVRAYITTTSEEHRRQLDTLVAQAHAASPICCLLGDRVDVVAEFHVFLGSAYGAS
jgi:organic hydroperoxide reductase OsmC/OhrA